jgi:hypothetical protein
MTLRWLPVVLVACSASAKAPPTNRAEPAAAKPATIAVQLAYRGTFMIGPPFSQVPPFTLLSDGTLIVAKDNGPVTTAKLSRAEADGIIRHVRDLGFDRLESHTDSCQRHGNIAECVSDAAFTILRVARADGTLREVTTYGGFSNEPAIHTKVVEYLEGYKPTHATPYRPTAGVLHVQVDKARPKPSCPHIDPAILRREAGVTMWAIEIANPALDQVLALAPANRQAFPACAGGVTYQLLFVPTVPGSDLSGELEPYKHR